jgi:hypothetical protein
LRVNALCRDAEDRPFLAGHLLEYEPHEWQFLAGKDDIAAIDVTDKVNPDDHYVRAVDEGDFVTREFITEAELAAGEDAFMLGMFTGNPGEPYNNPALRFGNISQSASIHHPVEQGNNVKRSSHIFDMHSRLVFSGSPVSAYINPR